MQDKEGHPKGVVSVSGSRLWCLWINSSDTRNTVWEAFGVVVVEDRETGLAGSDNKLLISMKEVILFCPDRKWQKSWRALVQGSRRCCARRVGETTNRG